MKKIIKILGAIVLLPVIYIIGVLGYAYMTDFQPDTMVALPVEGSSSLRPSENDSVLSIITWNLGFGGLGKEMDFFYDGGKTMRNSPEIFQKNINGILNTLTDSVDIYCFQEIDIKAKRSYQFNEVKAVTEKLPAYDFVFGKNYDVGFVPRPFLNPMGNVLGGILTVSRWNITEAKAHAYKNTYHFPDYLFYLDRCFTLSRIPVKGNKELILINSHNSAYDPGGKMKKHEMEQIKSVLMAEYDKGNYVIVGADWNQYPPEFRGVKGFAPEDTTQGAFSKADFPAAGWKWVWDSAEPSCRAVGEVYNPTQTYCTVIDYFLISPNVESLFVKTISNGFNYSDHQPVLVKLKLK